MMQGECVCARVCDCVLRHWCRVVTILNGPDLSFESWDHFKSERVCSTHCSLEHLPAIVVVLFGKFIDDFKTVSENK